MRILLISPWFPSPPFGGALIRVSETLRHLSGRHAVTLVAPAAHPVARRDLEPLAAWCEAVEIVPISERPAAVLGRMAAGLVRGMPLIQGLHRHPAMRRAVARLTAAHDYDVVHVEHSFMAPYLSAIARGRHPRTVLSMHNIESLRFRRELATARGGRRLALFIDSVVFRSWEPAAVRRFDGVMAVSGAERDWARAQAPDTPLATVPNGVDTAHFVPAPAVRTRPTLLFPGLMNYPPNIDAAAWLCDDILPRVATRHAGARVRIVGDKPTPEVLALAGRPGVEVTGRVPDVRPHFAECAAVVVPLRSGAGTRLKILEAMAMQRPVVSTTQGAEGLDVTPETDILLADTAAGLAAHVCRLLDDAALADRLARAGRELVERLYDWTRCFDALDVLYQQVSRTAPVPGLGAVEDPT
ncbi:MAG: glycosyltransferase [Vicinamibacterales bacterium]